MNQKGDRHSVPFLFCNYPIEYLLSNQFALQCINVQKANIARLIIIYNFL